MISRLKETLVGEALVGKGPEVAHIDLVIGPKGSAVEQAFVASLASPAQGHTPLLAALEPNLPAKPLTLMVNKVTIKGARQAVLMYGPAQAAVAKAVSDCVFEGILPKEASEDLFIIVSVFLEWDAKDKKKIYDYNYLATKSAIERAVTGKPAIEEILSRKDEAKHPLPEYRLPWVADGPGLMKSRTVCLVHLYPHKTHNEFIRDLNENGQLIGH